MTLKQFLYQTHKNGKCLLAANFYNLETLKGILEAAAGLQKPVILQASAGTIKFLGLNILMATVRSATEFYGVRAWLHLDHGTDLGLIRQVLDAGFDSVMIDASDKPFEQNAEISAQVVEMAKPYDANVEAELGYVPKSGERQTGYAYTSPEQAEEFVRITGVNALAIAVGTAHGFYKKTPRISYKTIKLIRNRVDVPLVLHGASGLSARQLTKAIQAGISKINIATEIKNAFTGELKRQLNKQHIDPRKYLPGAINAVRLLIQKKLQIIHKNDF